MRTNAEHANSDIAHFAIVLPLVCGIQGALEVKLGGRIERKAAVADVPFVLRGIVGDAHTVWCTYKKLSVLRLLVPMTSPMRPNARLQRPDDSGARATLYERFAGRHGTALAAQPR